MKRKTVKFLSVPLMLLLAAVPILCSCETGDAGELHLNAVATSNEYASCHPQQDVPRHENSDCDCPQHTIFKANDLRTFNLNDIDFGITSAHQHFVPIDEVITFSALNADGRFHEIHGGPGISSVPVFTKLHNFRL
jgi:hypothetical protein